MKTITVFLLALSVSVVLGASNAHAAGFGFYGSYGAGTADWTVDSSYSNSTDFSKRTNHLGAGLVMDTAPARDKLFNYQLNIGYDRFSNNNGSAWGPVDFEGVLISNNFGFGGMISPTTRLWFGPELRVELANGSPSSYSNFKIRLFGIGIGPVLGVNFNTGEKQTFAVKAGYQYLHYTGEGNGGYSHENNAATGYSKSYDYDVIEKLVYINLEFLFRTSGDR